MTTPSPIRLIIFDCDGVLVDSEPLAMRVLLGAIEKAGVTIPPDVGFRNYLGRSFSSVALSLDELYGLKLSDAALEAMRLELYETYRRELKPMPGLREVLPQLGVPFCVASSSHLERIAVSLEITRLIDRFAPRLYSASMVEHGKPAPDLFLYAAAQMGVAPADCLVIEDSPAGIIAAKKAGMRVFAFTGGSHIGPSGLDGLIAALKPDAQFGDMRELPGLIAAISDEPAQAKQLLVAVDVGTGSARAGVFTATGELLGRVEWPFSMYRPDADHAEQDSRAIWLAVGAAVQSAVRQAGVRPGDVAGISFDATCSLVVRDARGLPLQVGDGGPSWDTIAWLDHRAQAEAAECTATGHKVLDSIGGVMSPEMEVPKLMWLKRHKPEIWAKAHYFFDLADYLCWMAADSEARSHCTLTCKWAWNADAGGWSHDFLTQVGLEDLLERGSLPESASPIGTDLGPLSDDAARTLGLTTNCRVGLGLIDAHAGALGALGAYAGDPGSLHRHLALVAGTSSCVMALSAEPKPIHGVWGPYHGAVLPDTWLNEAGQSATGALLDHLIRWHNAGGDPMPGVHQQIADRVLELRSREGVAFGSRLHVLPDFHGNRSPEAEPRALGTIMGLTLDDGYDDLCQLYWRMCVGIALGIRHILETLGGYGYGTSTLYVAGGHLHNPLLMELYADATGCVVIEPEGADATLLGTAMVAATAAGHFGSLTAAAMAMQQGTRTRRPNAAVRAQYDRDYRVFRLMVEQRRAVEGIG